MSKSSKRQTELKKLKPAAIEEDEVFEDENEDDAESVYDGEDVDGDAEDVEQTPQKNDEDEDDDDDDDEDEDDATERVIPKKRSHVYHQVPDSTEITIIAPENRITSEYMTIYEYSMVVGTRATHITKGSILYTDPQGLYDARDIAKKEIDENKCPLSITRKVSPSMIEVWEVNEMIKPRM